MRLLLISIILFFHVIFLILMNYYNNFEINPIYRHGQDAAFDGLVVGESLVLILLRK